MSIYSFIIKKGQYRLELNTTDKELLSAQFEMWVREAGEYSRQKKIRDCKNVVNAQINAEEKITQKNIDKHISEFEKNNISSQSQSQHETKPEKKIPESKKNSEVVDKSLDIFYAPPQEAQEQEFDSQSETVSEHTSTGVFDNILEKSMSNPQMELSFKPSPSIKKDNSFLNYINSRKIEKKIDYLLLTAYYFSQFEQKPRFTLKQLNSKLMQNIAVIVDHSVLQEAINRDYIECLPDLTGLVGASEYRLTAYGEKTLLDA
ncbi:MAG: hypothetical protein MJ237_00485 [bacterium]|nr:hypothetical protein [bacterium]